MSNTNKNKGFTLIELMIAMVISLFVIAVVSSIFVSMSSSNVAYLKSIRLNHELRSALDMMSRDIRRAGHNQDAVNNLGTSNQFSIVDTTELKYLTAASTAASSPDITFSYDSDGDANIDGYGYRLNGGAVEYCYKSSAVCTTSSGDWEDLTDPNLVTITGLSFAISSEDVGTVTFKQVDIQLTGELVSDSDFSRTVGETVTVRNEHFK